MGSSTWIAAALVFWLTISLPVIDARIGYFWHISDFHFDANLTEDGPNAACWSPSNSRNGGSGVGGGSAVFGGGSGTVAREHKFGNYRCDSTWELVVSAVEAMKAITGENVEFIMWTGDSAARWSTSPRDAKRRVHEAVEAVTSVIRRNFPSSTVYPVVGGADVWPRGQTGPHSAQPFHDLAKLWRTWLPPEAEKTFKKSGYYVIEQARLQLHLVALNTNFYSEQNMLTTDPEDMDPAGQWAWLEEILLKARRRRGTVYLFGHIPPGIYERHYNLNALHWYQDRFNRKYLQLVQTYSDVIAGQFFGHAHTDSFRIIYDDYGRPISWILLAPAVSPREPGLAEGSGPNNPSIRLVKFDTNSGQVLDYTQYFLNLTEANINGRAEWRVAYNFTRLYGMPDFNSLALHNIASAMLTHPYVFQKYYTVNHMLRDELAFCGSLCRQVHYCAATQINYADYDDCIAKALLAGSRASVISKSFVHTLLLILVGSLLLC